MIQEKKETSSPYVALYDIIIPKGHELRRLSELVDFSFVDDMLRDTYTLDNGRPGYPPQVMFKYLMLKRMYELSDRDVVSRAMTDMAFKYFLGIAPEDDVIDPSSLTKFRKARLKDDSVMDTLIARSVETARENGIRLSGTVIVDSTHTEARYGTKSAREYLLEVCRRLRKKVYAADESYTDKMPEKPDSHQIGIYEEVVRYCQKVLDIVNGDEKLKAYRSISENANHLQETVDDINEELTISKDPDARVGHKTADTEYFGYKTHIAMTPERIITAATVTSGEKPDGKELPELVRKTEENGVRVENIVGDVAYSEKELIEFANEKELHLVSKLSKTVTSGNRKNKLDSGFSYNKDAQMYVCPAGHMAVRKARSGVKSPDKPQRESYFFDTEKCRTCPLRKKCGFKDGQKSKTYNVTVRMSQLHQEHQDKQETEYYQQLAHERYKIEAKNAELKNEHGYAHTAYNGQHGMTLQAGVSIFVVNLKRILTLLDEKSAS